MGMPTLAYAGLGLSVGRIEVFCDLSEFKIFFLLVLVALGWVCIFQRWTMLLSCSNRKKRNFT